jgi:nitric oxide reductase subunit B
MADAIRDPIESLSSWWRIAALATMAGGFAVLILLTAKAYQNAPPIPDRFVDSAGAVVFTADDVIAGQQVFLKPLSRIGTVVASFRKISDRKIAARLPRRCSR